MSRVSLLLFLGLFAFAHCNAGDQWLDKIRPEHPRLFINEDLLPLVKANAEGAMKEHYASVKSKADEVYMERDDIQFHVYECTIPSLMVCYFVEGEERYKDKALWVLREGAPHLGRQLEARKAVSWFSFARIALMVGYDWLYADLDPEERGSIARAIIENVKQINDPDQEPIVGENMFGNLESGFYGVNNLLWYAGLAFHGDGVDDELCRDWMRQGLADYKTVADFRRSSGGDDGGMSAVVLGYVFGAYPRAEWNLIHTWRSAIGGNIASQFDYLANITNWLVWQTINGGDGDLYSFGSGDVHHRENRVSINNIHLAQIQLFFRDTHPQQSRLATYLRQINGDTQYNGFHFEEIYPFLLDWTSMETDSTEPLGPDDNWAHARHFEFLGQFFMRSGFTGDDTYCLFTAGHQGAGHTHYDDLNFIIYKDGFLALDSGTRDQTGGRGQDAAGNRHICEYYSQTIAHNSILIRMPGEQLTHHWGYRPVYNSAGQNKKGVSVIRAFSTNDAYTYVNADATAAYNTEKAALVNRQFCYIYPNHFVVVDRVSSTQADYQKTWLLHTQNEPTLDAGILRAEQRDGVLYCKTLWPQQAKQELIGGPGKTAWVDGHDIPITEQYFADAAKRTGKSGEPVELLTGNWRLEVKPASQQTEDVFVHVMEVGNKGQLQAMHTASLTQEEDAFLVNLDLGDGRTAALKLNKTNPVAGTIQICREGEVLLCEELATTVQPQDTVTGN